MNKQCCTHYLAFTLSKLEGQPVWTCGNTRRPVDPYSDTQTNDQVSTFEALVYKWVSGSLGQVVDSLPEDESTEVCLNFHQCAMYRREPLHESFTLCERRAMLIGRRCSPVPAEVFLGCLSGLKSKWEGSFCHTPYKLNRSRSLLGACTYISTGRKYAPIL